MGEVGVGAKDSGAEILPSTLILFNKGIEWIIASTLFASVSVNRLRLWPLPVPFPVCSGGNLSDSDRRDAYPDVVGREGGGPIGLRIWGPMKSGRGRLGRR